MYPTQGSLFIEFKPLTGVVNVKIQEIQLSLAVLVINQVGSHKENSYLQTRITAYIDGYLCYDTYILPAHMIEMAMGKWCVRKLKSVISASD